MRTHSLALMLLLATAVVGLGGDWPMFRGPEMAGISNEKGLPIKWSKTENVRWQVDLPGRGVSCPVVVAGKVFVTCCSGYKERRLHVVCYNTSDGKKLWERQMAATGSTATHPESSMAAPTPASDGKRVFVFFGTGDLACYELDGTLVWYRALVQDYPGITNQVGIATSPLLVGETLLLLLDNAGDSFVAGFDVATGTTRWKVPRERIINWMSPLRLERGGKTEILFAGPGGLVAVNPTTGKVNWKSDMKEVATIASPVLGGGLVYVPGTKGLRALRPSEDGAEPEEVWKSTKIASGFATPLYHEGKLYGLTSQALLCLDATSGTEHWQERLKGPFWASPLMAEGRIYVTAKDGRCEVIQLGEKAEKVATNDLGEALIATPAIADGALFFRGYEKLFCIAEKK